MVNSKFKTHQTILSRPVVGIDNKFHYVYKMINIDTGKYYIGIHSTKDLNDGYCGSGAIIQRAYKKHGFEPFEKLILSFHDTPVALENAEVAIVTESVINDPLCYNINCGGGHHPLKTVTCKDIMLNKNVRIPRDEYYAHPERYVSQTKGQIKAQDATGKIFMAYTDDPRFKTGEIWDYVKQFLKDTFPAMIVATGQNIRVHKGDPRLQTGEVVHIQKGRVKVNKDGKVRVIKKEYLNAFLKSGWLMGSPRKGIKLGPSKCLGRCHIWMGEEVKVVNKNELNKYLADGWQRGNGPTTTLIYKGDICKRIPRTELKSYTDDGWVHGNPKKSVKGKISVHKATDRKFIDPSELDNYLADGWQRGLGKIKPSHMHM